MGGQDPPVRARRPLLRADDRPALARPDLLSRPGQRSFRRASASSIPASRRPRRAARGASSAAGPGERTAWPEHVPVRQTVPPRRAAPGEMLVTWIGHATVLVQVDGLNILTDPIWSETASPFPPIGPERVRAPGVRFEDLPRIDLVLVSHNHYDHLDLPTLRRLWRARPAADRHQPRQRHDPARRRASRPSRATGARR